MGYDCGFDMVPGLEETSTNKIRWGKFLDSVREEFEDDPVLVMKENYLEFNVGEHPLLPLQGHKFLRFGSKVSSGNATAAEPYIRKVARIARSKFGERIQFWHELADNYGHHNQKEVNQSIRSYHIHEKTSIRSTERSMPISPSQATDGASQRPFKIAELSNRDKGLIANANIPKGSRILSEKALFTISSYESTTSTLDRFVADKLRALSRDQQRAFLALHNNWAGSSPFGGIVRTNALPLGPGSSDGGIFLTASRINHSCAPNAQHTWNATLSQETIHAIHDIAKGDEITICYSEGADCQSRQSRLQESFGFSCSCSLCSLGPVERCQSDARQAEIHNLDESIGNAMQMLMSPTRSLAEAQRLLELLKIENISDARLPRAYYDAFQIVISHGDLARAKVFAKQAYETRLVCEGSDSPEVRRLKALMETPAKHKIYRALSNRWQTKVKDVPKEVETEELDAWLWKRSESL